MYHRVHKWIHTGCEVFLVSIVAMIDQLGTVMTNVRVVKEFEDVFPQEVPRLPSAREVEFGIDVLPSTTSISRAPY